MTCCKAGAGASPTDQSKSTAPIKRGYFVASVDQRLGIRSFIQRPVDTKLDLILCEAQGIQLTSDMSSYMDIAFL
jgi:hypothetical protein